ncbi:MAG: hypothetical protein J5612_01475 [Paludibacteraceae bacterium]|nr:hypothetical protein [Paludibacteraceae bacterium]
MLIWENNDDIRLVSCANDRREIQAALDDCREERRPYVFVTPTMLEILQLNRILVPVTMLEEETYKAEICTYLARKTGAHIILLKAHDYGSHAQQNINRIVTHIQSVAEKTGCDISYEIQKARKDSFSLYKEAVERQSETAHQLLVLTASREYGLDDILFGPPERHAIQRSLVPVMLINPRADLFSLCD